VGEFANLEIEVLIKDEVEVLLLKIVEVSTFLHL